MALLGHLEAVLLFVISGVQIGIAHRLLGGELVETQLRVLKMRRLERHVFRLVGFVVSLHGRVLAAGAQIEKA